MQGGMMFSRLEDSPMFRQQIQDLEEDSELLRDKCLKFYKGCRKYTEGLGEAYDRDIAFASSLETFGGGNTDPVAVSFGGPDMVKFAIALREIGTYKEVLRSQVEQILNDRLLHMASIDHQVKESRKRFDKADVAYDQVREKFLSLRKSTRMDIAAAIEEELYYARSAFEHTRFNLVGALSSVEAKKKYEFLEAVSLTMDAHLQYFKQGYELLHQMEPYINQVRSLTLDVKVWEPSVITLFQALGNVFVNSVWEGLLHPRRTFQADEIPMRFLESQKLKQFFCKPSDDDHISVKEKFIHAKYAEKRFVHKVADSGHLLSVAQQLCEGVGKNDKKTVYRLIVAYQADVNSVYTKASVGSDCSSSLNPLSGSEDHSSDEFLDGCSLLHLACQTADIGMVELLLQHGANINACDSRGQIPLHHSFLSGRTEIAKLLLSRGADPQAVDKEGKTPFHLDEESALNDVEILALLKAAIG